MQRCLHYTSQTRIRLVRGSASKPAVSMAQEWSRITFCLLVGKVAARVDVGAGKKEENLSW